jgi:chemotaxis signal transduction protein
MTVPKAIAELPRTEAVLLGVFDCAGAVLPSCRCEAAGLAGDTVQGDERLVVVRIGGHRLALVVDEVSVILRASSDRLGPAPSLFNRGGGEARIDSVLRLADGAAWSRSCPRSAAGRRTGAQLLAERRGPRKTAMAETDRPRSRERFLVIRLGDERYGLPIAAVDEVVRLPETLTRLPKAPAYVQGVMNLRGKSFPVIDQRQRFSCRRAAGWLPASSWSPWAAAGRLRGRRVSAHPRDRRRRPDARAGTVGTIGRPFVRPRRRGARGGRHLAHRSEGLLDARRGRPAARPDGEAHAS